jgi:hypothetical protein
MSRHNGEYASDGSNGTGYRPIPNSLSGVPYRDAMPDTAEIPLDQLDCFVIPAQDQNHVSEPIHFRLPPYLKRYMKIIVMAGRFPYLDIEDLIRHAVARHISWLCSIRETIPQHIRPSLQQLSEMCADDELRTQVEQTFERAEERVKYHMARGDQGEVIRLLNLMRARIQGVHDSARMREFRERFEKVYGPYLRANAITQAEARGRVTMQGMLPAAPPEGVQ